jgi:hypothetical protein
LAAEPSPSSSSFTSPLYGFAVEVQGWRPEPATQPWSGKEGDFGSDAESSDRFHAPDGETIWAVRAPMSQSVDQMIDDRTDVDAIEHECDPVPDSNEEITIGGEPARLTVKNCPVESPTIIATAAVVHGEDGYVFYFRHSEQLAPNPDAVDNFTDFLSGVSFPN